VLAEAELFALALPPTVVLFEVNLLVDRVVVEGVIVEVGAGIGAVPR